MKKVFLFALITISAFAMAQKAKIISGSFSPIKDVPAFEVKFDYTDLKVDKFKTEEEFLADKMKKRDEKGEEFKKNWFADREEDYEPKFIESFNKRGSVKVEKNSDAQYVITVKTTWIYPGYNVGVMRSDAKINAVVSVYQKSNPSNILVSAEYKDVVGRGAMGYDYDSGYRISESYARLAKALAEDIKKGK